MITIVTDHGHIEVISMREIKASEFMAKCLALIDEVAETGQAIVITKRGKVVARLEPYRSKPATLRGSFKGKIGLIGIDGLLPSAWDDAVEEAVEENLNRLARDILPPGRKTKRG